MPTRANLAHLSSDSKLWHAVAHPEAADKEDNTFQPSNLRQDAARIRKDPLPKNADHGGASRLFWLVPSQPWKYHAMEGRCMSQMIPRFMLPLTREELLFAMLSSEHNSRSKMPAARINGHKPLLKYQTEIYRNMGGKRKWKHAEVSQVSDTS